LDIVGGSSRGGGLSAGLVGLDIGREAVDWIGDIGDSAGETVLVGVRVLALHNALSITRLNTAEGVVGVGLLEAELIRSRSFLSRRGSEDDGQHGEQSDKLEHFGSVVVVSGMLSGSDRAGE